MKDHGEALRKALRNNKISDKKFASFLTKNVHTLRRWFKMSQFTPEQIILIDFAQQCILLEDQTNSFATDFIPYEFLDNTTPPTIINLLKKNQRDIGITLKSYDASIGERSKNNPYSKMFEDLVGNIKNTLYIYGYLPDNPGVSSISDRDVLVYYQTLEKLIREKEDVHYKRIIATPEIHNTQKDAFYSALHLMSKAEFVHLAFCFKNPKFELYICSPSSETYSYMLCDGKVIVLEYFTHDKNKTPHPDMLISIDFKSHPDIGNWTKKFDSLLSSGKDNKSPVWRINKENFTTLTNMAYQALEEEIEALNEKQKKITALNEKQKKESDLALQNKSMDELQIEYDLQNKKSDLKKKHDRINSFLKAKDKFVSSDKA